MRVVSVDDGGSPRAALLRDGRVLGVGDDTLNALLATGGLDGLEPVGEGVPVEEVALLPPLARPGKILCIGLNYRGHAEEQGKEPPETPTFFAKFATRWRLPEPR
jgi:2-keto-4-pentenoate hydratase/2-oxohepta-3-ene-1,7-dioic acid hydratase in catechol pathway